MMVRAILLALAVSIPSAANANTPPAPVPAAQTCTCGATNSDGVSKCWRCGRKLKLLPPRQNCQIVNGVDLYGRSVKIVVCEVQQ